MGSTNKTTGYELPQWIGTDKPTFLGDMNDAFLKIDEGMTANKGSASTAEAQAGQAVQDATQALTKANSVETTANQANTNAQNAVTIAKNVQEDVNDLKPTVNSNTAAINGLTTWIPVTFTPTRNYSTNTLKAFYNPTLKLFNVYGTIADTTDLPRTIGKFTFPFTLNTPRNISNFMFRRLNNIGDLVNVDVTFETNGNVTANTPNLTTAVTMNCMLNCYGW